MPDYIKHLVECNCILPQFSKMDNPPFHKFIAFSALENDTGEVVNSFVQCPNCGVIHRIQEIGLSKVLNKDSMLSIPTIDDIKMSLPDKLVAILERHHCDLPTWQEVEFIIQNELWGRTVILSKEREGDIIIGKIITILSPTMQKIEIFERFDGIIEL